MQYEAKGDSRRGLCRHGRSEGGCYRGEYARHPPMFSWFTRLRRREQCGPAQKSIPHRLTTRMRRVRTRRRRGTEEGVARGPSLRTAWTNAAADKLFACPWETGILCICENTVSIFVRTLLTHQGCRDAPGAAVCGRIWQPPLGATEASGTSATHTDTSLASRGQETRRIRRSRRVQARGDKCEAQSVPGQHQVKVLLR